MFFIIEDALRLLTAPYRNIQAQQTHTHTHIRQVPKRTAKMIKDT